MPSVIRLEDSLASLQQSEMKCVIEKKNEARLRQADGRTDGRDMKTAAAVSSMHSHLRTSMFLLPVFSTSQTPDSQNTLLLLSEVYIKSEIYSTLYKPFGQKGFFVFSCFLGCFFFYSSESPKCKIECFPKVRMQSQQSAAPPDE